MKRIAVVITIIFLIRAFPSFSANSYHVRLVIPEAHDSTVLLAHYYGLARPSIYIVDSVKLDKKGVADFHGKDTNFVGGIYIVILDRKTDFEFLLNAGDDISVRADMTLGPEGLKFGKITFTNSPENERFEDFVDMSRLNDAPKTEDYKHDYINKYPGTLLANIFKAMEKPVAPPGPYYLPDGTPDRDFGIRYYKTHYWDQFNFKDDRLICTPFFGPSLVEYMTKFVAPSPDSFEHESDRLLSMAAGSKNLFHYTLEWLSWFAENSQAQGMDSAYLYLLEHYYLKGRAFWLSPGERKRITGEVHDLKHPDGVVGNRVGNNAPEIMLPNIQTGKQESLLGRDAKYTLLIFFSPNCGHCQAEIPLLDSLYRAVLKDKGVKIFTVVTEGTAQEINTFITEDKIEGWAHHWDPDHEGDYHNKYGVYTTPEIYLLDARKKIIGRHLDHTDIVKAIGQNGQGQK